MPNNPDGTLSNWHTLFEDFSTSTQEFYAAVEEAVVRRKLPDIEISRVLFGEGGFGSAKRQYLRVSRHRVAFDICSAPYGNGHFFSWWLARVPPRFGVFTAIGIFIMAMALTLLLYLMLGRMLPEGFTGYLIKVPFVLFLYSSVLFLMGYMVQEGALGDEEELMMLPIIGRLYVFVFNPTTYYRLDTAMMFRDSIRAAVNEVINDVRQEKGLRLLSDEELRPDVRDQEIAG